MFDTPSYSHISIAGRHRTLRQVVLVMAVVALLVLIFANSYWITTLTSAMALALAARGVALLYGQLGLVSFCQFALVGAGGWVALRISHGFDLPFEITVLLAGVISMVSGMIWGAPALLMRGLYLALITLMLAGAFQIMISAAGFPDGGDGWFGRATATQRAMMERPALAQSQEAYFLYVVVWTALGFLLVEWLRAGRAGRAWAMIRAGETTAKSAGVNIFFYKMVAFGVAGLLAGIGGALLAGGVGQLDGRAFHASESLYLFALALVGGVHHWYGALIAGLLLRAVPSLLTDLNIHGYAAIAIYGVALLHALITAPKGIAGQISGLIERLRTRFGSKPEPSNPPHQEERAA